MNIARCLVLSKVTWLSGVVPTNNPQSFHLAHRHGATFALVEHHSLTVPCSFLLSVLFDAALPTTGAVRDGGSAVEGRSAAPSFAARNVRLGSPSRDAQREATSRRQPLAHRPSVGHAIRHRLFL